MVYFNKTSSLLILLILSVLSCNSGSVKFNRMDFYIPEHISIKEADLKTELGRFKPDPSSRFHIVIILYSFSSGSETVSFSGGDEIKTVNSSGRLRVLVKVMDGNNIVRAVFLEARGGSKDEMISSLANDLKQNFLD